jgi:hypothetical protein
MLRLLHDDTETATPITEYSLCTVHHVMHTSVCSMRLFVFIGVIHFDVLDLCVDLYSYSNNLYSQQCAEYKKQNTR